MFKQRLIAAKAQFTNKTIEVRIFNRCHDRFYILDNGQVWTLGASFNKAGGKATLLAKVKNETEKLKIISDFGSWWSATSVLKI